MMVWLPTTPESTKPLPAATIAFRSSVKASKSSKNLQAVNDQIEPAASNDHSVPFFDWWPAKDSWEWVQYNFEKPERISRSRVYWFDDEPEGGCRLPEEWEILYLNGNVWEPVKTNGGYKITANELNTVSFQPVITQSVKIKVRLNRNFSAGLYEWIIE
jgi:uncharacterized protein